MKQTIPFPRLRLGSVVTLALTAFLVTACAVDGYDDNERFTTVTGQTLESPDADAITITPDATGAKQTITWPLVSGAGGYLVSLYDVTDDANPVTVFADSLVDGTTLTVKRAEDTNYKLAIKTAANEKANNKGSETPSEKLFTTFTSTFASIPSGTDLTEYFTTNPAPADSASVDLCYDLEAGGTYTMSGALEPGLNKITLRCTNKKNKPTITFTGDKAGFVVNAGLTLKNIDFDCAQSTAPFIAGDASPKATEVSGAYVIYDKLNIQNCKIDNLTNYFFYDNKKTWYVEYLIVNNCLVHLTPNKTYDAIFWLNKGRGSLLNFTVSNSTFYETGANDYKYFYQCGGRPKNIKYALANTNYENSTFYHVAWNGQWGNYNGLAGQSTSYWTMTNCIFYDCSRSGVARRFLAGRQNQPTATFLNNTYMHKDGTFDDPTGYDNTGTDIKADPQFKDPENADFTISGTSQVSLGTGDPRWLPTTK